MKRWIVAGVVAALFVALLGVMALGFGKDPRAVPFLMAGKPAPEFNLKEISSDQPYALADYKGKKPLVINFWASWCGPCKGEHPVLEWGNKRYGKDVQFLGMVFEDTLENARSFLARNGAGFPQLYDPHSMSSVAYGVSGVPETYFITHDGVILEKHVGPISPQALEERIRKLLALQQKPPAAAQGGVQ